MRFDAEDVGMFILLWPVWLPIVAARGLAAGIGRLALWLWPRVGEGR